MHVPERVVETSNDTAVRRVRGLNNVQRSSSGEDWHTETKQQATSHELTNSVVTGFRGCLDDNTCAGNGTTDHHSVPAAPGIASRADERKCGDTTDLVHRGDDTGPGTSGFDLVILLESVVRKKRVEHRSIKTVAS